MTPTCPPPDISHRLTAWRDEAEKASTGTGYQRRYPQHVREQALALVEEAAANGMCREHACRLLGISRPTIAEWQGKRRSRSSGPAQDYRHKRHLDHFVALASMPVECDQCGARRGEKCISYDGNVVRNHDGRKRCG